ncbi:ionotropic receptor 75a-like [Culicoides brevitarsis]|uniref:ionotropic receptor 75a-like n=1 Tax=Culicoides brevitarsis TaxID=469753 RepID=UPI00307BCAA2
MYANLFISIGSNIVVAVQDAETGSYNLKQIYKVRTEKNHTYEENYGKWSNSTGLVDERSNKVIAVRRKNLKKEDLIVSVTFLSNASLEHVYDYKAKEVDAAIRSGFTQIDLLVKTFNASVRFALHEKFGYDETGIWVGSYGSVINDHADITATPLFVQARRIDVIDYIDTLLPIRAYFIFRFPNLSTVKNIYVLPFSRTVWLCLGAFIVISVLTAFFMMRSEEKIIKNTQKRSISQVIFLILSIVCQMGSELEARILSTRIFIFFSFFTSIFVFTSYTANIVALLQTPTKNIQTLQDLYESKLALGIEDTLYNRYYIGKTTDPVRLKIYKEKIAPPNQDPRFFDRKSGVAMMRNSSFAFFGESGPIFREIEATFFESEKCNLNMIEYLEVIEPYNALKKNSPYREIMKISLPRLREYGITKAEINRLYKKRPTCSDGSGSHFESVSVESIRGALLLLPYGMAFALVVFIAEIFYKKMKNRQIQPM